MICDACGREIQLGDWPFCPHGQTGKYGVVPDDIPGGMWVENGFDTPRKFYSHSAHRAALAAEGYEIRAKWAGPNDKIMTNWAASIDAATLESARILVGRGIEAREAKRRWPRADQPVTVSDVDGPGFRRQDVEP